MPKDRDRKRAGGGGGGHHGGRGGGSSTQNPGFRHNTERLGQHLLINPAVVLNIVQKAGVQPTDTVLEIGPGTGNLTVKLLEAAKRVVAIELDPRMVVELQKRFQDTPLRNKFELMHCDFMKAQLPYFDLCVANVPYQISSAIVFRLLTIPNFRAAVLMFQREFALRLVAKPGDSLYCRLSVNVQLLATTSHLLKVGKNCFRPPPKVESSVVRIEPKRPAPAVNFLEWDGLVRLLFTRKNRTIGSVFRNKKILTLLKKNMATFKALRGGGGAGAGISIPADLLDGHDDDGDNGGGGGGGGGAEVEMGDADESSGSDSDEEMGGGNNNDPLAEIRAKVMEAIEDGDFEAKRAAKMDQDDFLQLLASFNKRGIHFA
jgi:18S rRNA (adenine1779-N6/adenine1780-N6)-dimethyltransferase